MFIDESRYQLSLEDHSRRVWRRPGQCADFAFTIARHTGPQQGVMVWEDKAGPHVARVAMNCLTAFQTLSCPVRSSNLSLIKHVWDMIGRLEHLPGNVDDLAR
ncbi:transposable element Tc1 transposase [Trichonephila clavipes]|nr:transposable element Tc1 transposase [Trichonephila clavipes]